jgi:hypothetical protein
MQVIVADGLRAAKQPPRKMRRGMATAVEPGASSRTLLMSDESGAAEGHDRSRCTIVHVHNANGFLEASLDSMLRNTTAHEAYELLSQGDIYVTNDSDKETQLRKILDVGKVNDKDKEADEEAHEASDVRHNRRRSSSDANSRRSSKDTSRTASVDLDASSGTPLPQRSHGRLAYFASRLILGRRVARVCDAAPCATAAPCAADSERSSNGSKQLRLGGSGAQEEGAARAHDEPRRVAGAVPRPSGTWVQDALDE